MKPERRPRPTARRWTCAAGSSLSAALSTPDAFATVAALYEAAWAHQAGERTVSRKAFGLALAERGFQTTRQGRNRNRCWAGIGLAGQEHLPF